MFSAQKNRFALEARSGEEHFGLRAELLCPQRQSNQSAARGPSPRDPRQTDMLGWTVVLRFGIDNGSSRDELTLPPSPLPLIRHAKKFSAQTCRNCFSKLVKEYFAPRRELLCPQRQSNQNAARGPSPRDPRKTDMLGWTVVLCFGIDNGSSKDESTPPPSPLPLIRHAKKFSAHTCQKSL